MELDVFLLLLQKSMITVLSTLRDNMNELTFNFVPPWWDGFGTAVHSSVLIYSRALIVIVSRCIITN